MPCLKNRYASAESSCKCPYGQPCLHEEERPMMYWPPPLDDLRAGDMEVAPFYFGRTRVPGISSSLKAPAGRTGAISDQCPFQVAPSSIQRLNMEISDADRVLPLSAGGMRSAGSA